jgi:hypothetical protein
VCSKPATLVRYEKDVHTACLELLDGRLASQLGVLSPHFAPSVSCNLLFTVTLLWSRPLAPKCTKEKSHLFQLTSLVLVCILALRAAILDSRALYILVRKRLMKIGHQQKARTAEVRLRSDRFVST